MIMNKMTLTNIYLILAWFGTIVFGIRIILMLFGGDSFDDTDIDVDGDADISVDESGITFQVISLNSILGFITMFGWVGYLCI